MTVVVLIIWIASAFRDRNDPSGPGRKDEKMVKDSIKSVKSIYESIHSADESPLHELPSRRRCTAPGR